ncbi:MAG TPA: YajG family lipoprotein [Candidatus Binatia bacterium]|nr:YajG family lipoprotein [Candidatus Binatia bacterium]
MGLGFPRKGATGRSAVVGCTLGLALSALGLGCARVTSLTVPLVYRPTDRVNINKFAGVYGSEKIYLSVVDSRTDQTALGACTEQTPPVPVQAQGSAADFVRDALAKEFRGAGLTVVDSPSGAPRALNLQLTTFAVNEQQLYRTDITGRAELKDARGKVLWSGMVAGNNERWGGTLKAENYQEGLSDAVVMLADGILSNPEFQRRMK